MAGRNLFTQHCVVCHVKTLITAVRTYGPALSKQSLGGQDDVMRELISNGTPNMPGFKYSLEPAEIGSIIAYLKTLPPPPPAAPQAPRLAESISATWRESPMTRTTILARHAARFALGVALCSLLPAAAGAADALLSGTVNLGRRREDGGRHGLRQGRGLEHHHHGLSRRGRQLLLSAAAGRKLPGLGAGADLCDPQGQRRARRGRATRISCSIPMQDWVRQLPGDELLGGACRATRPMMRA